MKRVFVGVPMNRRTEVQVTDDLIKAADEYKKTMTEEELKDGVIFIDNYVIDEMPPRGLKNICVWMLGKALEKMATCDEVTFGGEWQDARGCRVEKLVKELYFDNREMNTEEDDEDEEDEEDEPEDEEDEPEDDDEESEEEESV